MLITMQAEPVATPVLLRSTPRSRLRDVLRERLTIVSMVSIEVARKILSKRHDDTYVTALSTNRVLIDSYGNVDCIVLRGGVEYQVNSHYHLFAASGQPHYHICSLCTMLFSHTHPVLSASKSERYGPNLCASCVQDSK